MKGWFVGTVALWVLLSLPLDSGAQSPDGRIDINDLIHRGQVVVRLKPVFDIGRIEDVFDQDPATGARTAGLNPARIILEFKSPFDLTKSRLILSTWDVMSSGNGTWSMATAETITDMEMRTGSYRVIFADRPLQLNAWAEAQFSATGRFIQLTATSATGDDYVYLKEWELYGTVASLQLADLRAERDSLHLWEGWKWRHTKLTGTTSWGTETDVPLSDAVWSSSNPAVASVDSAGNIFTHNAGDVVISASYGGQTATVGVNVLPIVRQPEFGPIDPYLATPAADALYEIPVLIIRYLPTTDGVNLDVSYAPDHWWLHEVTLEQMKSDILRNDRNIKFMMEERSRFRGYKNPDAIPSLGYRVVGYITVYEQTPPGEIFSDDQGYPVYWPDFHQIFERFDIAHYVNDLGVQEIWFWNNQLWPGNPSYDPQLHRPENFRGMWESNMASPVTGDISNSNRYEGDLPVYNATYVLFDRNMRRNPQTLHIHGHQIEHMLMHINRRQDGNIDLFWKQFVGADDQLQSITGRCGWTHMPPNTTQNYDYFNTTLVDSDIEDWTPTRIGQTKLVNVDTWKNLVYAFPEDIFDEGSRTEANWYIYWMQNMPGYGNTIDYGDNNRMTNWWLFTAKWDSVIHANMGLYEPKPLEFSITTTTLKTGVYKHAYVDTIVISGGKPPYAVTVADSLLPDGLVFVSAAQTIAGIPQQSGTFHFELVARDSDMPPQADTVSLALTITNHAPLFVSADSTSAVRDETFSYTARAYEPDANEVDYAFADVPSWLSATGATVSGKVPSDATDTSFVAIATDGELSDSLKVRVTLLEGNWPPRIVHLSDFSFPNDDIYTIQLDSCVIDSNNAPEEMVWTIIPADSHLSVYLLQHVAQFSAHDWTGSTGVQFKVTDPNGASDCLAVQATVTFPTGISASHPHIPETVILRQNYPNPFNRETTILFGTPEDMHVTISAHNVLGLKVADIFRGELPAGMHRIIWDTGDQPSGIYFILLKTNSRKLTTRALLLK